MTDLVDHLESFKVLMLLYRAIDGILCQAFFPIMWKVAWYCYSSLKPNFIHSFEQLNQFFATHFISSRRVELSSEHQAN